MSTAVVVAGTVAGCAFSVMALPSIRMLKVRLGTPVASTLAEMRFQLMLCAFLGRLAVLVAW